MKIAKFIENHFWLFLVSPIILGLISPFYDQRLMLLLKPELMMMLFLVFLKIDLIEILHKIKKIKFIFYISLMYLIIIPILFFYLSKFIAPDLAIGILLLTSMPAGLATPALSEILKGNTSLSMSIAIVTSLIAPLTVPLLFSIFTFTDLSLNPLRLFIDLVIIVFIPMVISQLIKLKFQKTINKTKDYYTSINILLIFLLVYTSIGFQKEVILDDPISIIWQLIFVYIIFILLHFAGYLISFWHNRKDKISIIIGKVYMNNGLGIVIAAAYFDPKIITLMVLSEIPWSTCLPPFRRIINARRMRKILR